MKSTSKKYVKGSIDLLVGTLGNGNKPCIELSGGQRYIWAVALSQKHQGYCYGVGYLIPELGQVKI